MKIVFLIINVFIWYSIVLVVVFDFVIVDGFIWRRAIRVSSAGRRLNTPSLFVLDSSNSVDELEWSLDFVKDLTVLIDVGAVQMRPVCETRFIYTRETRAAGLFG